MKHSVNDLIVNQFSRGLIATKAMLKKAQEQAVEKKFDENVFLQLRLAPDMFPLVRQVQIATDTAKGAVARLAGKAIPAFPDEEKTMEDVFARIDKTIEFIRGFSEKDFEGYAEQKFSTSRKPGVYLTGEDFLVSHAIPNFYFHMNTVYSLLRANGVQLGKQDFLGEQNWRKEI